VIRLLLYSHDAALQNLLAGTLGDEFCVFFERRMDRINASIAQRECDVLILDLDSVQAVHESLVFLDEIHAFHVPIVVMMDDENRATVLDLARRGFYNFIRKSPALVELRIIVRRALEYSVLTRNPEN
jgi:DNA-binding NtrC family response regulator